jgi:autotransporter strand-loop-strand O-heptosyltransferase
MGIQVVGHTSFLGHTGYNNHSKNFFTHLNKYLPTRIRNYTYCKDLSYLTQEQKDMIIEQRFDHYPFKVGTPFTPNENDIQVNIVLNESHHYFFYDHYESPKIAYNVWESTRQLPEYFNRILQYDQFWCPTQWQAQCTIDQGYPADKVKVVPEGVNGQIFKPSNDRSVKEKLYKKYNIPLDTFTFMIFGRWDTRKSTTEMVKAFVDVYGNNNSVQLILSADNPFGRDGMESTEERLKHYGLECSNIKVLHFPPREEYIQWMQHGDCLLSCSRSEGWNLPLMEAISCGTVSICSDWGGHLQFADGVSYKVNVPNELPPKDVFMLGDEHDFGVWGEPDFNHLAQVMENVYKDFDKCQEHSLKMSEIVREEYTWENAAKIAEGHIKELAKNHFVIKQENKQKVMNVKYSETDDGYPKITFNPLHNKKFYNVTVIVRDLYGQNLYQSKFDDLNPRLDYWMTIGTKISILDGITIQFIDNNGNLIQKDTKRYQLKEPIVSFVTSFYNAEQFVDEVADSIINQTFTEWEWIVTDDWSDDNTKKKVENLTLLDKRIRYVEQKEKQEIYWNPHKYAKGEIICTIDADDVIVPKAAEVLVHFYNIHPNVQCIHVNANFHEEEFTGHETFKNSSFVRMDKYDSILQKHQIYLNNESGYERVGYMFGTIRSYRNPGEHFDFNDGDFKLGKHEDLAKLLRLEEIGTPLYLNRTLYKVRMRSKGNNSGHWHDYGGDTEFEKMRETADKRRSTSFRHLTTYDSIREELNSFLYSDLNDEKEKRRISCLGFGLSDSQRQLIQNMYFDHEVDFEKIDRDYDYVFAIIRSKNDIEYYEEMTKDLRKAQIQFFFINDKWEPSFYDTEDGESYFKLFKECKDWLVQKRGFMWTTYLYKYCSIIYNLEKKPVKLNLGCGNDILPGYVNVDKYNNTGNVDYKWDLAKLEVEDGHFDEIYTSHVFEHIGINDIYAVVEEWKRALKPRGDLIIRVPNLEHEVNGWLNAPDDQKWKEIHRIFGSQSHPGNAHYCGFNPGSLKAFLETFDLDVIDVREQNVGYGQEIRIHAKNTDKKSISKASYVCHFVDGPFLQINGSPSKNYFVADFLDPENNSSVHQELMNVGFWTRPHRKYFTEWLIEVKRNGKIDFRHKFNAEGKRVLISFDSKSLGDTLAWFPYVVEFQKKHNCKVCVSTFWNRLLEPQKQYAHLDFIKPGGLVEDLYASYTIGCYENDMSKNKNNWRSVPLQKVASDFLGLDYKEIVPRMSLQEKRQRPSIDGKYVCLSEFSTFQCKFWNYPDAWQQIVDHLNELGYKVVVISKEATKLKNIINRTNRPINETINTIRHCEFFLGVSAGPSWLAWALEKPVIMISGYSARWGEFSNKIKRVINEDVCHGCFNDPNEPFDRGDWNWCPRHKGTPRQFECSKKITPAMVKEAIHEVIEGEWKNASKFYNDDRLFLEQNIK